MAKKVLATDRKPVTLKDFATGVNKKDEISGLKIKFAFCNRKRRGG
ncbi:MAG: hypothetical protein TUN42_00925 [Dehalogenimonas sp.]